jgi:ABC-type multidrug transport system ATPase subunit
MFRRRSAPAPLELAGPPDIRCRGLSVTLDHEPVLREVDLDVPPGRTLVLLGPSGAGKSTLIRHVLGTLRPDDGAAFIGGCDVWNAPPAELRQVRRTLSALLAGSTVYEGSVYASLTVRQNLLATLHERLVNPSGPARRGGEVSNPYLKLWNEGVPIPPPVPELAVRAQSWLDRFALAEVADLAPHEVSAGQRRRAALASALAVDARLYVLDDPDGALDWSVRDTVIRAIAETRERNGATLLLVTHDHDLAAALGDVAAVLDEGTIRFVGDVREAVALSMASGPGPTAPAPRRPHD